METEERQGAVTRISSCSSIAPARMPPPCKSNPLHHTLPDAVLDATNCPLKSHRLLSAASPNRTRRDRPLLTLDSVRLHLFIPQTSPALLLIPLGFLSILCLGPSSLLVRLVLGVSIVSFQSKRGKSAHKKTGHTCAIYTPPLQNLDTAYLHLYIQQGIFAHNNRQHVRPHSKGRYARHPRGKGHDPC